MPDRLRTGGDALLAAVGFYLLLAQLNTDVLAVAVTGDNAANGATSEWVEDGATVRAEPAVGQLAKNRVKNAGATNRKILA